MMGDETKNFQINLIVYLIDLLIVILYHQYLLHL